MRIDKYLKVARIVKRRTIANELAANGRVWINEKLAKPSSEVKVNDLIRVRFGVRELDVRVLQLEPAKRKEDQVPMYEIVGERKLEEKEEL